LPNRGNQWQKEKERVPTFFGAAIWDTTVCRRKKKREAGGTNRVHSAKREKRGFGVYWGWKSKKRLVKERGGQAYLGEGGGSRRGRLKNMDCRKADGQRRCEPGGKKAGHYHKRLGGQPGPKCSWRRQPTQPPQGRGQTGWWKKGKCNGVGNAAGRQAGSRVW